MHLYMPIYLFISFELLDLKYYTISFFQNNYFLKLQAILTDLFEVQGSNFVNQLANTFLMLQIQDRTQKNLMEAPKSLNSRARKRVDPPGKRPISRTNPYTP